VKKLGGKPGFILINVFLYLNKLKTNMSQNINALYKEDNPEQPTEKLKWLIVTYNIFGLLLSFIVHFYDSNNGEILLLIYPLLGIVLLVIRKGIIKIIPEEKIGLVNNSIFVGYLLPAMVIAFITIDKYTLLSLGYFWIAFGIASASILTILYVIGINPLLQERRGNSFMIFCMTLIYAFGGIRQINCAFDYSSDKTYRVAVLNREEHHGKGNSYNITLSTWGLPKIIADKLSNSQEIDEQLYRNVKKAQ